MGWKPGTRAPDVLDGIDLPALKPSFDRIVRVAMTLLGAADGEVVIRTPGRPWYSKSTLDSGKTDFIDLVGASKEVVWV
ncbi:MAG TPA: hypothetical protein VG939_04280, partial [Caulobacteraceae bacterium]|nr:hypothetical protein [Caulobacteraceae bacterium]